MLISSVSVSELWLPIVNGGMLYLEVEDNRLDAKFIRRTGVIADQFTIMKDVNKTTNISIDAGTPTELSASWVGNYSWSTAENTRSITVAPTTNTTYTVTDVLNCVTDVFNITINTPVTAFEREALPVHTIRVQPTLLHRGEMLSLQGRTGVTEKLIITDIAGRVIRTVQFTGTTSIETRGLQAGMYFIKSVGAKMPALKFVVQ